MNVFTDLHHGDLYYSLYLLFEKRLGWKLYRPIGIDWYHHGFWKIAEPYGNNYDTIIQYLSTKERQWDQFKRLNGDYYIEGNIYQVYSPIHDYYQKAITLNQFKDMKFDIILSTIKAHEKPYISLRDQFQPKATLIAQVGNTDEKSIFPNVMHSVPYIPVGDQNTVFYHQELDMKVYRYVKPDPSTKNIYSVINCLPYEDIYSQYKKEMVEVSFKAYGAGSPDGSLQGTEGVAAKMREANIGWHAKPLDGFGHSAMGWFASGRPVITMMKDIVSFGKDIRGLEFWEPGVTCIDIESGSVQENCVKIREALEPENNLQLAENAYKRFHEIINYTEEEAQIREFLERSLP